MGRYSIGKRPAGAATGEGEQQHHAKVGANPGGTRGQRDGDTRAAGKGTGPETERNEEERPAPRAAPRRVTMNHRLG